MSSTVWNNRVQKLLSLFNSDPENISQAFVLLETVIDMAIADEQQEVFAPIFKDISLQEATCGWLSKHLRKLKYSDKDDFLSHGYFWTLFSCYVRLFPEVLDTLPTTMHMKHAVGKK